MLEIAIAIALFSAGWVSARFDRVSDERIALSSLCILGIALAITRGNYFAIFPDADSYDPSDNMFLGMTPNQISSFIIFGASFYLGLFLRNRKKLHVSPENKITARAEIFPKSRFLEVEISNPTDRRLLIRTIALSSSDGLSPVRLSPSSDCEVSGNVAYIKLMLAPNDELSVELETRDMNKVSEIWVHGVEVDTLNQWHVNAELTRKT